MAHTGALPGSPLFDADGGIDKLIEDVSIDIEQLQSGVDSIMFGNENDRPYVLKATPESIAAMTMIVSTLKPMLKVPFGVNYFMGSDCYCCYWFCDGCIICSRNLYAYIFASDMGVWAPDCAQASRLSSQSTTK